MAYVSALLRVKSGKAALDAALEGLVRLNLVEMTEARKAGRPLPPLYRARPRWKRDDGETWDSYSIVLRRGFGDCEDLAAARAAELRLAGVDARAVVKQSNTPGVAWHAVVLLPSGEYEDPSRKLGM